jgi:hypothetical protein
MNGWWVALSGGKYVSWEGPIPVDDTTAGMQPQGLDQTARPLSIPATPSVPRSAIRATVKVDGLRYRRGPRTSCDAIGQYPIGTKIEIVSYTSENTTVVNGDP